MPPEFGWPPPVTACEGCFHLTMRKTLLWRTPSIRGSDTAKAPLGGRLSPATAPDEASQGRTPSAPERRESIRGSATAKAPCPGDLTLMMLPVALSHGITPYCEFSRP